MSRAFVKEDIDIPERIARRRKASGLPPDALNFITQAGARKLRHRVAELKRDGADESEIADLESMLDCAMVVKPVHQPESVLFGVRATLRSEAGEMMSCRIVGVDEVALEPQQVSWLSPIGKALLGARLGQRISLEPARAGKWTVISLE